MTARYARRNKRRGWMLAAAISLLAVTGALYWILQTNTSATGGDGVTATDTAMPAAAPDITGQITKVLRGTASADQQSGGDSDAPISSGDAPARAPDGDALFGVLVEEDPAAKSASGKAQVGVRNQTRILKQEAGTIRIGSVEDLKEGQRVRAWLDGPVAESYPVQAAAGVILILAST